VRATPLPAPFARPIAHRGLHGGIIVENTQPAFAAAMAGGFGIECDVRPVAGGLPVVFHDSTLDRLTNGTGPLDGVCADDLAQLRHRDGAAPILTLAALLALVDSRAPLLIEVKSEWCEPATDFLDAIATLCTNYRGPAALMSFDPAVIGQLATLAPTVPRGLVSGSYRSQTGDTWWADQLAPSQAASLRDLADFDRVGASFVAYEVAALPNPAVTRIKARGWPVFAWTVRTTADRAAAAANADQMIFEGFCP
jgi:glycerophosphoryl diester phosphodiesterase